MRHVSGALALILLALFMVSGCGPTEPAVSPTPGSEVQQFEDFNEMGQALGFDMVRIEGAGYVPQSYAVIRGQIGQIIYINGDVELNMRMARDMNTDISGVNGAAYTSMDISGIEVHIGAYKSVQSAWFTIGDMDYGMSATNTSSQDWEAFVRQYVTSLAAS